MRTHWGNTSENQRLRWGIGSGKSQTSSSTSGRCPGHSDTPRPPWRTRRHEPEHEQRARTISFRADLRKPVDPIVVAHEILRSSASRRRAYTPRSGPGTTGLQVEQVVQVHLAVHHVPPDLIRPQPVPPRVPQEPLVHDAHHHHVVDARSKPASNSRCTSSSSPRASAASSASLSVGSSASSGDRVVVRPGPWGCRRGGTAGIIR